MRSLVFLLLSGLAVSAQDSSPVPPNFDVLIGNLASDEATVRASAAEDLIQGGAPSLEKCRAALKSSKNTVVRSQLESLIPSLEDEILLPALRDIWRNQWFVMKLHGEIVGREHDTAQPTAIDGRRGWSISMQADLDKSIESDPDERGPGRKEVWRCLRDSYLTAVESEFVVRMWKSAGNLSDKDHLATMRQDFRTTPPALRVLSVDGSSGEGFATGFSFPHFTEPTTVPSVPEELVAWIIERDSLARRDEIKIQVWRAGVPASKWVSSQPEPHEYRASFVGEESIQFQGGEARVRHYRHVVTPGDEQDDFWVEDARGLLHADVGEIEVWRTDEATAKSGEQK